MDVRAARVRGGSPIFVFLLLFFCFFLGVLGLFFCFGLELYSLRAILLQCLAPNPNSLLEMQWMRWRNPN